MTKTTNLQLNKPDKDDFYNINVQNENMDIIDTKVAGIDNQMIAAQKVLEELGEKVTITSRVTGEDITITNSAEVGIREFKIDGRTEQVTTTGKNLFNNTAKTSNVNGVTFTVNEDKSVTVNGTATNGVDSFINQDVNIGAGQYILSGCPSGGDYNKYHIQVCIDGKWNPEHYDIGNSRTIDVTQKITQVAIVIAKGATVNNLTFYPMIRLASVTDGTYEPYTGGKPSPSPEFPQDIKGIGENGEIEVTVTGKNLFDYSRLPTKSANGVTVKNNGDGSFMINAISDNMTNEFMLDTTYTHEEVVKILKVGKITFTDVAVSPYSFVRFRNSTGQVMTLYSNYNVGKKYEILQEYLDDESFEMDFGFYGVSGSAIINRVSKPILYQDGDGTWEKYKSQTVKIPLSSPLYEGDYARLKGGRIEIYRKNKMVEFPNIPSFSTLSDLGSERKYYVYYNPEMAETGFIGCDRLRKASSWGNEVYGYWVNPANVVFAFPADSTVETVNAKMAGAKILYRLKEPTTEVIENVDLSTYSNITHVTNSDKVNMKIEYFVNNENGNVIGDLQDEVTRLRKLILQS